MNLSINIIETTPNLTQKSLLYGEISYLLHLDLYEKILVFILQILSLFI